MQQEQRTENREQSVAAETWKKTTPVESNQARPWTWPCDRERTSQSGAARPRIGPPSLASCPFVSLPLCPLACRHFVTFVTFVPHLRAADWRVAARSPLSLFSISFASLSDNVQTLLVVSYLYSVRPVLCASCVFRVLRNNHSVQNDAQGDARGHHAAAAVHPVYFIYEMGSDTRTKLSFNIRDTAFVESLYGTVAQNPASPYELLRSVDILHYAHPSFFLPLAPAASSLPSCLRLCLFVSFVPACASLLSLWLDSRTATLSRLLRLSAHGQSRQGHFVFLVLAVPAPMFLPQSLPNRSPIAPSLVRPLLSKKIGTKKRSLLYLDTSFPLCQTSALP